MDWQPGKYLLALVIEPEMVDGFIYRGLGMYNVAKGSPKGRRTPLWLLTHIGTGHSICSIMAQDEEALRLGALVADCGNWDFDSLLGWRDRDPELLNRAMAIIEANPKQMERTGSPSNHESARRVAEARA